MATVRWTITDPVVGDTYTFGANPNQDQTNYQKNLQFEAVVTPGAPPLLYEGQDNPPQIQLSGTSLAQSQWQQFVTLFERRHQVLLTDDRDYTRWVYITGLQGTRTPSALYPWKMNWQMTLYLFSDSFPGTAEPPPITVTPGGPVIITWGLL